MKTRNLSKAQIEHIGAAAGQTFSLDTYNKAKTEQEEAVKALAPDAGAGVVGYNVNPNSLQGFTTPLRVEDLDAMVKQLTYGQEQFVFFNKINKEQVQSTVRQYISYDKHGEVGHALAMHEGELSKISSPRFTRKQVRMKYLSAVRQVSIQAELAQGVSDPLGEATRDAIITLAGSIEWMGFYGDSGLHSASDTEGTEFDGLTSLIDPKNVIDLRGKSLSQDDLQQAAITISRAYGNATDAFLPNAAKAKLVNDLLPSQRVFMGANPQRNVIGFDAPRFQSVVGPINLNGSNLMDLPNILDEEDDNVSGVAPVVTATAESTTKLGNFLDSDVGQLNYKVRTVSGQTKSPIVDANAKIAAVTDTVNLEVSLPNTYGNPVEYVEIYREAASGSYSLIGKVSAHLANGGKVSFNDADETIPGTVDAFVGDMSPEVITLYEFLPISRLDLATLTAMNTWAFMWFGALALFIPRRWVRLHNVGAYDVAPQR